MKFGVLLGTQFLENENPQIRFKETLEQVELIREMKFDSIFLVQHFLADFQFLQTMPMLGRLTAEAGDLQIGTGISVLPLLQPVEVAEQWATLDVMTGGKMIFGVGTGYRDHEFNNFGVNKKTRISRFEESLDIITKLWKGEKVNYSGKHFNIQDAQLSLLPPNKEIPVWIGAMGDKAIERSARKADAWIIAPDISFSGLKDKLAFYRDTLKASGKSTKIEYPIIRETCVADTQEEAKDIAKIHLEKKYKTYNSWGFKTPSLDEMIQESCLVGSPQDVIKLIELYKKECGINHIIFRVQWPGMEQEKIMNTIKLIGEQVIPNFKNFK